MEKAQTISWIFLAIALCSESEAVDFAGISQVADGINHAVPTQKEMQYSISWLKSQNLIIQLGKKYSLSESGKEIYLQMSSETKGILNIWKNIENRILVLVD